MSRLLCIIWCCTISTLLQADCLKGNCNTGNGTTVLADGSQYTGGFSQGLPHGKGIMKYSNGDKYLGRWANGKRHGKGKLIMKHQGYYIGSFVKDRMEGFGTFNYDNGDEYKGYFSNGKYHGTGIYTYSNGKILSGSWDNDTFINNSEPIVQSSSQTSVNASSSPKIKNCNTSYCHNCIGTVTMQNGNRYTGRFENGKANGYGKLFKPNGTVIEGTWKNNTLLKAKHERKQEPIVKKKRQSSPTYNPKPEIENTAFSKEVKIFAVIVGIAAYNHMPSLRYTDDDAYKIYAFLKSPEGGALPDDQIKVLIDDSATKDNILESMEELYAQADENDMIMLYFSGHGLAGSFIPHDFDGIKNRINHKDVEAIFQKSRAKHKICYADACYSGSYEYGEKTAINTSMKKFYNQLSSTASSTALLMSSRKNEISLEFLGLKQGVFSHFLIKGLGGEADTDYNKVVTIDELFGFVKDGVRNYTGYTQTPVIMGNYIDNMPVAMVR